MLGYMDSPLLVPVVICLRSALEGPGAAVSILENFINRLSIILLHFHQLIRGYPHHHFANIIKAAEPKLAHMVTDTDGHYVPIFWAWMSLIAAFAAPLAGVKFGNLLIATFG
jgi:hypothetical protein